MVRNLLFFISLLVFQNAFSKDNQDSVSTVGLITSAPFSTTLFPFQVSTLIYEKSFDVEEKKFLKAHLNKIKVQTAQGAGNYLDAYFYLCGCYKFSKEEYFLEAQKNYLAIFLNNDINKIHQKFKPIVEKCSKLYK